MRLVRDTQGTDSEEQRPRWGEDAFPSTLLHKRQDASRDKPFTLGTVLAPFLNPSSQPHAASLLSQEPQFPPGEEVRKGR